MSLKQIAFLRAPTALEILEELDAAVREYRDMNLPRDPTRLESALSFSDLYLRGWRDGKANGSPTGHGGVGQTDAK